MPVEDAAQFFSKSLMPTIGGRGSNRRVPFTFTSTRRLLLNDGSNIGSSRDLAKISARDRLARQLKSIENDQSNIEIASTVGLSSALSASPTMSVISMMVNPHMIKWHQPKRFSKRDTMEGSTFFHFSNKYGQNNDILTLQFTGNTGNINTQNGIIASTDTGADIKLRVWHELYALTREPMLITDKIGDTTVNTGVQNEFFITYQTVLMPMPITLVGFFNSVLEFTESVEKPYSRDYSFGFTVTDTSPSLDQLVEKINNALTEVGAISAAKRIL